MFRRQASPPVMASIPDTAGTLEGLESIGRAELAAYRRLLEGVGGSRAVLVTGSEAKTSIASGLASAAVAGGRRAVLVECDLTRPTLAARLSLTAAPGLADYLTYRAEAGEILQPVVLAGPVGGRATDPMVCIVAGGATAEGAAMLASAEFGHAMEKLRSAYDIAVLDAPPLVEEEALVATVRQVDFTLAACRPDDLPRRLRAHVDGIVEPR